MLSSPARVRRTDSGIPPIGSQSRSSFLLVMLTQKNNLHLGLSFLGGEGEKKSASARILSKVSFRCVSFCWHRAVTVVSLIEYNPVSVALCALLLLERTKWTGSLCGGVTNDGDNSR